MAALVAIAALLLALLGRPVQAGAPAAGGESGPQIAPTETPGPAARLAPDVRAALAALPPGEMMTVIVTFRDQAQLAGAAAPDRSARLGNVVRLLQATAERTQAPVRPWLAGRLAEGRLSRVVYFWIFNGMAVTATADVIQELAARPEVQRIRLNKTVQAPAGLPGPAPLSGPEQNLEIIHAPALWERGFRGEQIVVANMDTGVDAGHPDLGPRWRGGSNSWFDPNGEHPLTPTDRNGHGTQTMGLIVGGDAGGTSIGVAPEARWIAVKIFDDKGVADWVGIHQGFQWLLDPDGDPDTPDAPHVVNNSWTFQDPGCDLEFRPDLQALRAAGIVPIFAAGNTGPGGATSVSPANYPEALAVGATNNGDLIYPDSSRGPSSCGQASTTFPELVAPGVGVRTADLYALYFKASGTSMAAPHVAGALALLLSAEPGLTVAQQEAALLETAVDLGSPGADNDYGRGRLDVLGAYLGLESDAFTTSSPALSGTLVYSHTLAAVTAITIPEAAVTETTRFYFTAVATPTAPIPAGLASTGRGFSLAAYRDGNLWPAFVLSRPVTISLSYTGAEVDGLKENGLTLGLWDEAEGRWLDAATTCLPASSYEREPSSNRLAVSVCQLGEFALYGPEAERLYLPLILSQATP